MNKLSASNEISTLNEMSALNEIANLEVDTFEILEMVELDEAAMKA